MTRYSLVVTAMIAGPLLAAHFIGTSEAGAQWRAKQMAQEEAKRLGFREEVQEARPRKKKDEQICFERTGSPSVEVR